MNSQFYKRRLEATPEKPVKLPVSQFDNNVAPSGYIAESGLVDAVNTALLLNQPLLLTGQPGTGKTQLAFSLAWQLGYGDPLRFQAKSTSKGSDLFYTFDDLARFHASKDGQTDALPYIRYHALGLAILYAKEKKEIRDFVVDTFPHPGRRRSVVLIDEVDKTPRDFPNDILAELEEMTFRVPELGSGDVKADKSMKPVVVITSNSEKHLPEAFLRRCVYYDIPFPEQKDLTSIIESRLGKDFPKVKGFLGQCLELFDSLRQERTALTKTPATAELIDWLTAIRNTTPENEEPWEDRDRFGRLTLSLLIKTKEDQSRAKPQIDSWVREIGKQ